ncbi:protein D3-like [Paramacrobiotus metropolitanus]|uniref:protein D3-like n=1 Tax=Paramacrobiotus metropolitanus TaxID=2943436 RepID=UPI0024464F0A|nr:protein D3-like [Paramacrobiotus metropolitanus]
MQTAWHWLTFTAHLLSTCTAQSFSPVADAFARSRIAPDVLDTPPNMILAAAFGSHPVQLGNELTPTDVINQPVLVWSYLLPATRDPPLFTLIELDLDAPTATNTSFRSVLHWLVYNIPNMDLARGTIQMPYTGSKPDANTGLHRYALLLFRQPARLTLPPVGNPNNPAARIGFDLRSFIQRYNLGQPVAGNFYVAQADAYSTLFWMLAGTPK